MNCGNDRIICSPIKRLTRIAQPLIMNSLFSLVHVRIRNNLSNAKQYVQCAAYVLAHFPSLRDCKSWPKYMPHPVPNAAQQFYCKKVKYFSKFCKVLQNYAKNFQMLEQCVSHRIILRLPRESASTHSQWREKNLP